MSPSNHIQQRKEQLRRQRAVARLAAKQKAAKQDLVSRSLQQQQTALYLAQFAGRDKELGMDQTNVEALCLSLTVSYPLLSSHPVSFSLVSSPCPISFFRAFFFLSLTAPHFSFPFGANKHEQALTNTHQAEAPQDVVNAVNNSAAGAAEDMTDEKRAGLMRLRALIDKALATDSS